MEQKDLSYHVATLVEQNKWIMKAIAELKTDVKHLNAFKWKAIGAGIVVGILCSFAFEVTKAMVFK